MKSFHIYFFTLKIIILITICLISLKHINNNYSNNILLILDSLFKLSFGLFLIIFFLNNNISYISKEDKVIFIVSGFILILLIKYIDLCKLFFKDTVCEGEYNK